MPINLENVTAFAFVMARMSGFVFLNPILGRRNIPAIVKTGLVLVLSIVLFTYTAVEILPIATAGEYMFLLAKEFGVGYVIGFLMSLFSYVIILGGELIDFQIGISMAKVFDAQSNMSIALSSTFYNIIYTFLFFLGNGHLTLIHFLLNTTKVVPFGKVIFDADIAGYVVDTFCQATVLGVKFSMPIVAVGFLIEMGVGLLMRIIPQINVFVINIQLKLFVGLMMIILMYGPFVSFLEQLIVLLFRTLEGAVGFLV